MAALPGILPSATTRNASGIATELRLRQAPLCFHTSPFSIRTSAGVVASLPFAARLRYGRWAACAVLALGHPVRTASDAIQAPRPSTLAASMTARDGTLLRNTNIHSSCVSVVSSDRPAPPLAAAELKPSCPLRPRTNTNRIDAHHAVAGKYIRLMHCTDWIPSASSPARRWPSRFQGFHHCLSYGIPLRRSTPEFRSIDRFK